jgi:nucleoside-diphosphate-sugar epimerase
MDLVVHMAADPNGNAPWESVLRNNIIGTYNVFEACCLNGVKRVIAASTIMVSWGYWLDEPYKSISEGNYKNVPAQIPIVTKESPIRPSDLYPASKVWSEALGRCYSDQHGLSVIMLRIGGVRDPNRPGDTPMGYSVWCSHRDIAQIVERCIDAPDSLRFDIFYVVSNNKYRFVDIEHARKVLGYVPLDSADVFMPKQEARR